MRPTKLHMGERRRILNLEDNLLPQTRDPAAEPEIADVPELTGRTRLCALTRSEHEIGCLLRFGAGPDGVVVPDLALRLPGRGVWVLATRACVEDAVRRNVFAKSLKRAVKPPADLAERIDGLMVKRVLEALSLANKSGLVTPGFAKVDAALEQGNVVALIHGQDGAADGTDRLNRKFHAINAANAPPGGTESAGDGDASPRDVTPRDGLAGWIVNELTIDQISLAIGRSNVVHAALLSGGAATRLLDEAKRLKRFRTSPDAS